MARRKTKGLTMFDTWAKTAGTALVFASVLGAGYTGVTWTHDKVQQIDALEQAVADEHITVQLVGERLENKIIEDQYNAVQQRQWSLDQRYQGITKAPATAREEYQRLESDKDRLQRRLTEINERVRALSSRETERK